MTLVFKSLMSDVRLLTVVTPGPVTGTVTVPQCQWHDNLNLRIHFQLDSASEGSELGTDSRATWPSLAARLSSLSKAARAGLAVLVIVSLSS